MATYYSGYSNGFRLRLDLTPLAPSIANNTTQVNYSLKLEIGNAYFVDYGLTNSNASLNGTQIWSASVYSCGGMNRTEILKSGQITVNHASDGTGSFPFSARFETTYKNGYTPASALNLSGTMALVTIPRASKPTLSASSVAYGAQVTINTNRASTAFTHTVTVNWGGVWEDVATGVTTSYAWTVPNAYMSRIPNSTSAAGEIWLKTYNGSTQVGDAQKINLTTTVPASIVPTIDSTSATEAVAGLAAQFGAFVQGKSKIKMVMSGSGAYGSTIAASLITVQGESYATHDATSGFIRNAGDTVITYKATDSRGRVATATRTISALGYSPPLINAFSVYRSNSDGSANHSGTFVRVNYNATVTALGDNNTRAYSVRWRIGTGSWTTGQLVSDSYTPNTFEVFPGYSISSTYQFELAIADWFGTATATASVGTEAVFIHERPGGKGLAIGKISEKEAFEVAMPVEFTSTMNSQAKKTFRNLFGADPNTITDEWCYSAEHANCPTGGGYWYLQTIFYEGSQSRLQIAYGYLDSSLQYQRQHYGGTWGAWRQIITDDSKIMFEGAGTRVSKTVASGISANYTDLDGNFTRQTGNIVTVNLRIKCISPTTSLLTAFTVPAPADSENYVSLPIMDNLAGRALGVSIDASGAVKVRYGDADRAYYGTITYIAL